MGFPKSHAATGYTHQPPCTGESKTRQEFKDECDIHKKLELWRRAGINPLADASPGIYGDFYHLPEAEDFLAATKIVSHLTDAFSMLPGVLRQQLGNNPENLIHWLSDPENRSRAVEYGILDEPDPGPTIDAAPPEPNPAAEPKTNPEGTASEGKSTTE